MAVLHFVGSDSSLDILHICLHYSLLIYSLIFVKSSSPKEAEDSGVVCVLYSYYQVVGLKYLSWWLQDSYSEDDRSVD